MQNSEIESGNSGIILYVHSDVQHPTFLKVKWTEHWRRFSHSQSGNSTLYFPVMTTHRCYTICIVIFFLYHLVLFSHPHTLSFQNNTQTQLIHTYHLHFQAAWHW